MGDWRKSTYSDGNGGQCVEVASQQRGPGPGHAGQAGRDPERDRRRVEAVHGIAEEVIRMSAP